jgi:hypothetical protein
MCRAIVAIAAVLIDGGLFVTVALIRPLQPRTVFMATGAQGGGHAEAARRYHAVLSRNGVHLELRATHDAARANLFDYIEVFYKVLLGIRPDGHFPLEFSLQPCRKRSPHCESWMNAIDPLRAFGLSIPSGHKLLSC